MKSFENSIFMIASQIEKILIWRRRLVNVPTFDPLKNQLNNIFLNLHRKEPKHIIHYRHFNTIIKSRKPTRLTI